MPASLNSNHGARILSPVAQPHRDDPWQLVWGQPYIDAERMAAALEDDLRHTPDPDFRTRLRGELAVHLPAAAIPGWSRQARTERQVIKQDEEGRQEEKKLVVRTTGRALVLQR